MMNLFQKKFILGCLNTMETILSDDTKINEALKNFSQGKPTEQRYHCNNYITDAHLWTEDEKVKLASVISEAIVITTLNLCTDESLTKQISQITDLFLKSIVPKITQNTSPNNRLESVQWNILALKSEIDKDPVKENKESVQENPYTFFNVATAALALVAATAFVITNK